MEIHICHRVISRSIKKTKNTMAKSTIFLNIETDDLIQIFDNALVKQNIEDIFERILDRKIKSITSSEEEVLDFDATLKFLGIKQGTLYKWTSEGSIPHNKKGKLFFIKKDLIDWIKSGKVKTNAELDVEAEEYVSSKINGK